VNKLPTIKVDFLEAGSGPVVMLVHSSVSGARQWRRLIDDLKSEFHVRAVNLFGYGKTPPWPMESPQSLDDQARLVLLETNPFYLLKQSGQADAFAEAMDLRNCVKKFGALGDWATAAERFADYWGGAGSWQDRSPERRNAFVEPGIERTHSESVPPSRTARSTAELSR
jgi:pimeloyl-ACP methyl ester carboxylesterase